ncbi:unnamed protein product [Didymodactylos carnosus]|uniref:Pentapeptide repeat-containing protein n=1 Tax=Didymodactylos carnosus TaxID=1234261 RepID=A0A8S2U9L0_9BILA|nr:unnamed protein product [Didymodactylos carnosus]CAF4331661.1 unnamed protein product [Didymodactylos carnosus]
MVSPQLNVHRKRVLIHSLHEAKLTPDLDLLDADLTQMPLGDYETSGIVRDYSLINLQGIDLFNSSLNYLILTGANFARAKMVLTD